MDDVMKHEEHALLFDCAGEPSIGIVSVPTDTQVSETGLLIVVGGPQYRVGSHRLFVRLARHAASQGIPAMRFDYRGMGDSWTDLRSFESVDDDLRGAVDAFFLQVPTMKQVVLWGLCDGASAACLYAPRDKRVAGLVLVNPWVHTPEGSAATRLRHYYLRRLFDGVFWRKLIAGKVRLHSLKLLMETVRQSMSSRYSGTGNAGTHSGPADGTSASMPLPRRMGHQVCLSGAALAIALSDDDPIAREFEDRAMPTDEWRQALSGQLVELARLQGADHTVTSPMASERLCQLSADWVRKLATREPR
jgi:exosortase A-associated hydrolase 1